MASRGTTFAKLDRERARKAKAAEKRERRFAAGSHRDDAPPPPEVPAGEELSPAALLRLVEELHAAYADHRISFEDFEARKTELMARISVD